MEECYKPLYNKPYGAEIKEWIENHLLWEKGEHPDQKDGGGARYLHYAQWSGNAPDVEYYRPDWKPEEMTWYQVYETVSEGTPVTPPFATKEELIEYLTTNGDFWDQRRRKEGGSSMQCDPWPRDAAERFVNETQWAPSFIGGPGIGLQSGHLVTP